MTRRTVLIVGDGWQRGTLSATRALGASGHRVILASTEVGHAARSRFAETWVRTPPVGHDVVRTVAEAVAEHAVDAVFAGDDEHLLTLSACRDELAGAAFPYPPHDTVLGALDKLRLYETAREAGVSVPAFGSSPPGTGDRWVAKQRLYAAGAVHACYTVDSLPADVTGELIYQEAVEGGVLAAVVTFRTPAGELVYLGGQRAERVFPEPYGVSVRARVVDVPQVTAAGAERLLDRLGWWGLAELQYLVTPEGDWRLIDLNGRYFGSLALSIASGADLPTAWLDLATGSEIHLPPRPRSGLRYQWLEGDLRRTTEGSPHPVREAAGALRYAFGARHSLWQADDPVPATRHLTQLVSRAARKTTAR